jgi:adenylate cyclase
MLYQNYINPIMRVKEQSKLRKSMIYESGGTLNGLEDKQFGNFSGKNRYEIKPALAPENSIENLAKLLAISPIPRQSFAIHPDYQDLEKNECEEGHASFVFVDLKGSTALYNPHYGFNTHDISHIKDTILRASIDTCTLLGGHVQRLQGDGIMMVFAKKEGCINKSRVNALVANAFLAYFIKYELKAVFNEEGYGRINARIGVDFGYDKDVLWRWFGHGDCVEQTTESLHTNLSAKLQANAGSNEIMVGENIKSCKDIEDNFFKKKTNSDGETTNQERYIFQPTNYKQWNFDWEAFLLSRYDFMMRDKDGKLSIDYNSDSQKLDRLRNLGNSIRSGEKVYTKPDGQISTLSQGLIHKPHKFYCTNVKK